MSSFYVEPKLIADSAIIGNVIIKDSDIFKNVGYKNYVQLTTKYPGYFKYFKECDNITDGIGYIPISISIFTSDDPEKIKKDIVKTIYYGEWISNNSDLVLDCKDKILCNPTEFESTTFIWIFICIILITLLFFSTYILIKSPHVYKLLNISETGKN